jgi:predicted nucleic acid-binding protein
MQGVIISDTSCLILLDKIQELDLLRRLFGQILTTQIVAEEFGGKLPEWVLIRNPKDKTNQSVLEISLDAGEASAIALAMEQEDCLVIIDELKGRKIAKRLGLAITGTLGVIIQAKRSGHVALVRPLLARIKQTDFRLNEQLEDSILKQAGE